jgi:hypothetical protein
MKELTKKLANNRDSDLMMIYTRCQQHERLVFRKLHPTAQASRLSLRERGGKMYEQYMEKLMQEIEGGAV